MENRIINPIRRINMKAYKVDTYRYTLLEVEIQRFTPKMVVLESGRKQYKDDGLHQWFETHQEAKEFLLKSIENNIQGKYNAIDSLLRLLEKVKSL